MRRLVPHAVRALTLSVFAVFGVGASAGSALADSGWQPLDAMPAKVAAGGEWVRPKFFRAFKLDRDAMRRALTLAPLEGTPAAAKPAAIDIPMPSGELVRFSVIESPVMAPELQAQYPDIRTYIVWSEGDRSIQGRIDLTPSGFHAALQDAAGGKVYVDPYTKGDWDHYASYRTEDMARRNGFRCLTPGADAQPFRPRDASSRTDGTLRTYRMACSATAEYTGFHSAANGRPPNVADGLAAVVTAFNRINQVFESELTIRFVLVAQNNRLIWTNPATDPFTNAANPAVTNDQNQASLGTIIGSPNYDAGHVFHLGDFGGLAGGIGTVCREAIKGKGYSSLANPVGDPFTVVYVCHEIGHQVGMYHTFNSCNGGQAGNGQSELEPGSGSTIMSYAGICTDQENLQEDSDAMFHSGSFDLGWAYMSAGSGSVCAVETPNVNRAPSVNAGPDYTIPKLTPFTLSAAGASDPDLADVLTYSWEQRDIGQAIQPGFDNASSPIIRTFLPTTNPSRTIPNWDALRANVLTVGEILPQLPRAMKWRLTVRDNHPGGGGLATDDMVLNVTALAGPFRVTTPNTNIVLAGLQTVRWDVANTNGFPINCELVRIKLSTDGGVTFPTILADNVPNTGSADVLLPSLTTSTARIMIESIGNIFFDISDVNFRIAPPTPGVTLAVSGVPEIDDRFGNGNDNGRADPGERSIGVSVALRNSRATAATSVTATLTTTTPGVVIRRNVIGYPDIAFNSPTLPIQPFVISLPENFACGSNIALRLAVRFRTGAGTTFSTVTLNATMSAGVPSGLADPMTFTIDSFTAPVPIPDNATPGLKLRIPVSGVSAVGLGVIGDLDFRINSNGQCDSSENSPTAGIAHSYVGDLVMSIISPTSTSATLMNRPGFNFSPSSSNNFCNTLLDDDGVFPFIQEITNAAAPYSGSFRPISPMSVFDDQPADGTWVFDVQDQVAGDTGTVRSVSLIIRPKLPAVCVPAVTPRCRADLDDGSNTGIPDGGVTIDDAIYFVLQFEAGSIDVDLDDGSNTGTPDGAVTIEDVLFFVQRFEAGC